VSIGAAPTGVRTAEITDVEFESATLNLFEDGVLTDTFTVF
jgi:hypothetical protein